MVEDNFNKTHEPRQLIRAEVERLADRCLARGSSSLFDPYQLRADFLLISALLRELARNIPAEGLNVEVWKEAL
jgi:hypothetical protein